LGRRLGADLPDDIQAVTVQAHRTDEFSEDLSPAVSAAIPVAASAVVEMLVAGAR
jgi:Ni,Fe-hydrogenase maturation factor